MQETNGSTPGLEPSPVRQGKPDRQRDAAHGTMSHLQRVNWYGPMASLQRLATAPRPFTHRAVIHQQQPGREWPEPKPKPPTTPPSATCPGSCVLGVVPVPSHSPCLMRRRSCGSVKCPCVNGPFYLTIPPPQTQALLASPLSHILYINILAHHIGPLPTFAFRLPPSNSLGSPR